MEKEVKKKFNNIIKAVILYKSKKEQFVVCRQIFIKKWEIEIIDYLFSDKRISYNYFMEVQKISNVCSDWETLVYIVMSAFYSHIINTFLK